MIKDLNKIKKKNIIIFSDLTNLFLKNDVKKILKDLSNIVDLLVRNNNTIIIPAFNMNFPKSKKTSSNKKFITTGYFNKYLVEKYSFKRTNKPIYNYGLIGPNTKKLFELNQKTAFGIDSIIGYLSMNNSYAIGLGVDPSKFNWVTIHVCEELYKVPYRFYKVFKGTNIDTKKKVFEKMYVRRKRDNYQNYGFKVYKKLIKNKKIKSFKSKNVNITLLNLTDYFNEAISSLKKDIFSLVK
tara:strand:+ start:440 stop:1159 length:720 start_codon:yes stop_codon:yes gene_type:complete